jgi:Na+/proline symporter
MHPVDIAIIVVYLVVVVAAGLLLTRQGGKSLDSYFLGERKMGWFP